MSEMLPYIAGLLRDVLSGIPHLMPELILACTFIVVIFTDLFFKGKDSAATFWLCLTGLTASFAVTLLPSCYSQSGHLVFGNTLFADRLSIVFKQIFYFVILFFAVFVKFSPQFRKHSKGAGDLYILLPVILLGLNLMSMASSLLLIYLSVEMISIASYLMVGYVSGTSRQTEAAMKYVLFGSACSAMMLYGMSLLYAFTGTLNVAEPQFLQRLSQMPSLAGNVAVGLVLVGIGFKLSFVPLHFWSPDVYEGAPTPVTAFLSTGPKIAGFAILVRFTESLSPQGGGMPVFDFQGVLSAVAILSMLAGNFTAVWQDNIKRMLAYSSIGHTGFILMAVIVHSQQGLKPLLFYLLIYAIMNMAAFILAGRIEDQTGAVSIRGYKGLGRYMKLEMVCFVVILISLTGLPPLAGFMAKFLVFSSVLENYSVTHSGWLLALLITAAVTTVVSLFYYFKVPLNAFLRQSEGKPVAPVKPDFLSVIILILTSLLLLWGIFPGLIA